MVTRRYTVQGRVQGVGFRYFTRRLAEAFDITGYARNMPAGDVEIVASGAMANHRSFKEQLEIGPSAARVDRVLVEEMTGEQFDGFRIVS